MMANDPNKNDWFKAGLVSPENTLGDFKLEGLSANNTQLLSKDAYKEKDYVKEAFVSPDGKFDDDSFNRFYDQQQETFNAFVKDEYDEDVLNGAYHSDLDYFAPKDAPRRKIHEVKRERISNPNNMLKGHTMNNISRDSGLTIREIAQTQKVYDPFTKKYEEYSPNDLGFWGTAVNKETLVLSKWEEDGKHYDDFLEREVEHKKGEHKLNEQGMVQYEKLGNRSVYGKEVLNPLNVVTKDGTFANKFDFLDADSKSKSFIGTIMKTASEVAPYVIPKVKSVWIPLTLTRALATDLLPTLSKSVGGAIFGDAVQNSEYMQSMNYLQGVGKRFTSDNRSDEGMSSTFNKENILGMAGDVFGQIAQQRYLAKIPMWLGSTRAEAALLSKARENGENVAKINEALVQLKNAKDTGDRFSILRTAFANQPGLAETLNKYQRWSGVTGKALGMTYMSGISATGIHEEAKEAGLDDRDAGFLTLGLMAGMGALMNTDLGEHTLKGLGLDDMALFSKKATKEQAKRIMDKLVNIKGKQEVIKELGEGATEETIKKAWYNNLFSAGKNVGNSVVNKLTNALKSDNPILRHATAEAMEEVSEEMISDALKGVYNGLSALGYTSTDKAKGFDFSASDMLSRYLMSAMGGAIGGGIMGGQMAIGGKVYSTLPDDINTELSTIVINGLADDFRDQLTKEFKKGTLPGNPKLTPNPKELQYRLDSSDDVVYEPVSENGGMSQNEFIYNVLNSELDFIEKVIYQEGDMNNLELKPIYKMREAQMVDLKHNSAISDDIEANLRAILDLEAQIADIEGGIKDATQGETQINQNKTTALKFRANQAREELDAILNGQRASEYVGHAIFHLNNRLSEAYGVKDLNSYAESIYNKPLEALNDVEREELESGYEDYVNYEKRKASKVGYQRFKRDMEIVTKHGNDLKKWAEQRRILIEEGAIDSLELETDEKDNMGKISKVFGLLANLNADMDLAVQSPMELSMSQTDIPQQVQQPQEIAAGINIFEDYLNLLRRDKYVNPELVAFLDKSLNNPVPFSYQDEVGNNLKDLDSVVDDLTLAAIRNDTEFKYPSTFFTDLGNELKMYLNTNFGNLTYKNINDVFEKLDAYQFTSDDIETWMTNKLKYLYDPNDDNSELSIREMDEQGQKEAKDFFLREYGKIITGLKNAFFSSVKNYGDGVVDISPDADVEVAKQGLINSAIKLAQLIKEKEVSPFHEMLNEMASIDGVAGMEQFFDTIARQYEDSYRSPEEFIINSGLDVAKLKYGINSIARLNALLTASTTWEEQDLHVNKLIGYTNAMNNISIKGDQDELRGPLPEFNTLDFESLYKDLSIVEQRAKLMLNLSNFNINGTVRESKVLGARALTLYINSVAQESDNFKLLQEAGLDTAELEIALNDATQYMENMKSINSDEDQPIPFNTNDAAFTALKKEADKIEQAIYKLFNIEGESTSDRATRLRNLIKSISTVDLDPSETSSFTQTTKRLPKVQQLFYLFQSATIDPKQFYNDMGGDIQAQENDLTNSKLIPFLNQELVIKQLYFYTMSKYKTGIDVYSELMKHIMPVTDAKPEDRNPSFGNREDLFTLHNAIFLDGVPGAGKTSTAANFLNKMIARYDLSIATFAPYIEQVTNLNSTLEYTDNLLNPENSTLDDLFTNLFGIDVYDTIKQDANPVDKSLASSSVTTNTEIVRKRLEEDPEALGFEVDRINTESPAIAKLLQEFERFTINGKVPNVIVIDEATHISLHNLELLSKLIDIHNAKNDEKISLVLMGDTEQNGATVNMKNAEGEVYNDKSNLVFSNIYSTPKLSQAFRSFYSTLNENISMMRNFRNEILNKASKDEDVANTLTLKYKIDSRDGLIGFKTSDYSKEDLEAIFNNSTFQDKVAIITDKIDSDAVNAVRALGVDESKYEVIPPNRVQGLERDYVIVDLKGSSAYTVDSKNILTFDTEMNTIYTSLTRAKKGALINDTASGAIYMKSTSENVQPYRVELNKANLEAFRTLTENVIRESHSELEDLPQNFSLQADNTTTFSAPTISEQELADTVLSTASNNVESVETEDGKKVSSLTNTPGQTVTDGQGFQSVVSEKEAEMEQPISGKYVSGLSLSYMYHERLGALINPVTNQIDSSDAIENAQTNNSDLIYLAKAMGFYDGGNNLTSLNENLEQLQTELRTIRTGIFTHQTIPNAKRTKLKLHLLKAGVSTEYLNKLANLDSWRLKIMVKPYTDFDHAQSRKTNVPVKDGGDIAYLVLANPENPNNYITISAMPNVNNPNIPQQIRSSLSELYAVKSKLYGAGTAFFDYDDKIVAASNLVLRRLPENKLDSYDSFVAKNSHLNVSEPLILSGDLFTSEDSKELDQYIKGMSLPLTATTDNKHRLRGLPFMLVSTNKSIVNDTNSMISKFKGQVKSALQSEGFVAGDMRLVMLRPKVRTFSDWFNWNAELGLRFNKGESGLTKDLAAAENNYVAAKILSRFTLMLSNYYKAKRELSPGNTINYRSFLPDSIARGGSTDQSASAINERVDKFMKNVQALMNVAVPAMLKMRYVDYVVKLTNYGIGDVAEADIAISELFKRSDHEIKDLQKNFYNEEGDFTATNKAKEHYITKRMLDFVNAKLSNVDVQVLDFNEAQIPLNKQEKGALINMVVALRTAINGGTMKVDGQATNFQEGIFGNNQAEKTEFLKQLDTVITSNNQGSYQSLFPGGINSNIVYRRRNDSNKFTGVLPFAMETGVENTELYSDVEVQLPKLFVNLAAINLDGVQSGNVSPTTPAPVTTTGEENQGVVQKLFNKVKTEYDYHVNKRTDNINDLMLRYAGTLFDLSQPAFKDAITRSLDEANIISTIGKYKDYSDASVDALISQEIESYDNAVVQAFNNILTKNKAVLKDGSSYDGYVNASETLIPGDVRLENDEIKLKWQSAEKVISRYVKENDIMSQMETGAPEFKDLIARGYKGSFKTSNGTDFIYMLENSDNSEIFGKFVLSVGVDPTTGYPSDIDSRFEYLRREAKSFDLTDYNEFKKHVNNMLTDNKELLNKFDNFITALELAVENDFSNINNEDAVKDLSSAYLSASLAVRQDPAALQALQDLYRDYVNAKKC